MDIRQRFERMTSNLLVTSMLQAGSGQFLEAIGDTLHRHPLPLSKGDVKLVESVNAVVARLKYREFVLYGHFRHADLHGLLNFEKWKIIVLIRDPRDVILSYIDELQSSKTPAHRDAGAMLKGLDPSERTKILAKGFKTAGGFGIAPFHVFFDGWLDWYAEGALVLEYENIGSVLSNIQIAEYLDIDPERVNAAFATQFANSQDKDNRPAANRWKREMTDETLAYLKEIDNGLVEALGYSWTR